MLTYYWKNISFSISASWELYPIWLVVEVSLLMITTVSPNTILLPTWTSYNAAIHQSVLYTFRLKNYMQKVKIIPCHIYTVTLFRKKSKSTYCWMWILNYTTTPINCTSCAISIPNICSHKKFNLSSLDTSTKISLK
jgi:hypothetical protein